MISPRFRRAAALALRGALPCPPGMSPREFEAYQLFLLAESGVEQIRVHAAPGPETPRACREANGTTLSVDAAMRHAPIPHRVDPPCRCTYRPAGGFSLRSRSRPRRLMR